VPPVPDVIGLPLDEARARLANAGVEIRAVTETRPPKAADLTGALRVVRMRGDGPVDLVVTRERYVPTPRSP
jgi:hypothetical protein